MRGDGDKSGEGAEKARFQAAETLIGPAALGFGPLKWVRSKYAKIDFTPVRFMAGGGEQAESEHGEGDSVSRFNRRSQRSSGDSSLAISLRTFSRHASGERAN